MVSINQLKNRFVTELLYVIPGHTTRVCVRVVKSRISTGAPTANMREVHGLGECLIAVHSVRMAEPRRKAPDGGLRGVGDVHLQVRNAGFHDDAQPCFPTAPALRKENRRD